MIQELVELGERLRTKIVDCKIFHDALKEETVSIDCVVDKKGNFCEFIPFEKKTTTAEAITAKKGKARLLLDKPEEVLGFGDKNKAAKKHELFMQKLLSYRGIKGIDPVLLFYGDNKKNGIKRAYREFTKAVLEKERSGNIAFRIKGKSRRVHEEPVIYKAIIDRYETEQKKTAGKKHCSICGKNDYSIEDIPHGMIKKVPSGQTSGCALVSYNVDAFESYGLTGNENSSICMHCAKAYVESLNWLMQNGRPIPDEKGKERFVYSNRKKISSDTAVVFWTRQDSTLNELHLLDKPDNEEVMRLIESVYFGKKRIVDKIKPDIFYAVTLSGAAARIAVRDWIETSVQQVRFHLAKWFSDIGIVSDGKAYYVPLYLMSWSCDNPKAADEQVAGRVGTILWHSAIENLPIPLWILSIVLSRIKAEQGAVTPARASLIKLYLNRKPQKGGYVYMEQLDTKNKETAYLFGRIFAVLESIQWHALGETNASVRERFFSSASTTPGLAFGRLMNLTQKHLSKLKGEKPGLAVVLDRELQVLCAKIEGPTIPAAFRLEEQGSFALGYYHQKNKKYGEYKKQEVDHE